MDNERIPRWLSNQSERAAAFRDARQEHELAGMLIEARGAGFWRAVLDNLRLVANNAPTGLCVVFDHSNFAISPSEDHCRIKVASVSLSPRMTHADLWYRPVDKAIRCFHALTGLKEEFPFCAVGSDVRALSASRCETMTADQLVQLIVEPINDYALIGLGATA